MVNPERPTTPDSIAVHHILDAHVADPAFWKEFAADVLRPSGAWMRWPPPEGFRYATSFTDLPHLVLSSI